MATMAFLPSFSFLLCSIRVILKRGIEYVSDLGLLRSRRPIPYVFIPGLVDNSEEVHEDKEDAVGGIASTREDFGGRYDTARLNASSIKS